VARLKTLVAAGLLLAAAPARAGQGAEWSPQIAEASNRFGIPEPWIRKVIEAESGGRTRLLGRPIVSRAGAIGLMQLMPATWRELSAELGLGTDPNDPRDNILAGTSYLRAMYDRFGYPGMFAAYNAGPARFAEHLTTGRALPPETVAYAAAIAGGGRPPRARSVKPGAGPAPLFVALGDSARLGTSRASASILFVPLGEQPAARPASPHESGGDAGKGGLE
jgi:soluble lytic murein transglycosylase-like protein